MNRNRDVTANHTTIRDTLRFNLLVAATFATACASGTAGDGTGSRALRSENSSEEIALGGTLFFDTRLSGNDKQSCATCQEE